MLLGNAGVNVATHVELVCGIRKGDNLVLGAHQLVKEYLKPRCVIMENVQVIR